MASRTDSDVGYMRRALALARRAKSCTSPNPMVGAVVVKNGRVIGEGWHHRAGAPHAEIEALRNVESRRQSARGATLYVTLEPCCTTGRTPPCTQAIISSGLRRVVVAATDPNPAHAGRGFQILQQAGIAVTTGILAAEARALNEVFNHWIMHRTPFVTVKAAMTLDGKIATADGQSKWITGTQARAAGMRMRLGSDAILVGINTVLADDPSLTVRLPAVRQRPRPLRRIILDTHARTPPTAKVASDEWAPHTIIVTGSPAPPRKVQALASRVQVWQAPVKEGIIDLRWLLRQLGHHEITSVLVEGGGEVNAAFLHARLAQRVTFFYAPLILGGHEARRAVAGESVGSLRDALKLRDIRWRRLGPDRLLTARVD